MNIDGKGKEVSFTVESRKRHLSMALTYKPTGNFDCSKCLERECSSLNKRLFHSISVSLSLCSFCSFFMFGDEQQVS